MRVMGIDPGSKRIGVALSDPLGVLAQPLATVERGSDKETVDRIRVALGGVEPKMIAMGLPLRLDGTEGGSARKARALGELLREAFGVPVQMWDERMTTAQAQRVIASAPKGRASADPGARDRVAAAIILQSFLDAQRDSWLPGP